jgi:hypothetical protein
MVSKPLKQTHMFQRDKPVSAVSPVQLGKHYGVSWQWLKHLYDMNIINPRNAESIYYGYWNIAVPHNMLLHLPSPSCVLSIYRGAYLAKKESAQKEVPLEQAVAVELAARLIDRGRIVIKQPYETIEDNIRRGFVAVSEEEKARFVGSFVLPYLQSHTENNCGLNFYDCTSDAVDKRHARLKEFWRLLKDHYRRRL